MQWSAERWKSDLSYRAEYRAFARDEASKRQAAVRARANPEPEAPRMTQTEFAHMQVQTLNAETQARWDAWLRAELVKMALDEASPLALLQDAILRNVERDVGDFVRDEIAKLTTRSFNSSSPSTAESPTITCPISDTVLTGDWWARANALTITDILSSIDKSTNVCVSRSKSSCDLVTGSQFMRVNVVIRSCLSVRCARRCEMQRPFSKLRTQN